MLQAGSGPERMFSQMRSRNLLLIGCRFGGWLSRFFIRLSNTDRLSSDQRTKKEYLVGSETSRDQEFVVLPGALQPGFALLSSRAPRRSSSELHRRWSERNPAAGAAAGHGRRRGCVVRRRHHLHQLRQGGHRRGQSAVRGAAADQRRRRVVRQERAQAGRQVGARDPRRASRSAACSCRCCRRRPSAVPKGTSGSSGRKRPSAASESRAASSSCRW